MIFKEGRWSFRILTAFLLLPLFFINVKDSHDWGDDFAQYLIQTKNILEGKPQTDNGLLFTPDDPAYAIEAYPVGFPLLILPVYALFDINFFAFSILQSFFLFLTGIFIYEFFRKRSNEFIALLIALIYCYNFHILDLKKHVLSEIPFTFFLMLFLLWFESDYYKRKFSWIFSGILFAFLISIRLAGIAFLVGFIIHELSNLKLKKGTIDDKTKKSIYLLLISGFVFWVLNGILLPINAGGLFNFYIEAFHEHELQLSNNTQFYYEVLQYLFPSIGNWISPVWIIFTLAGWLIRLLKNPTLIEYAFPVYILLIIFYPYANAGLRFLLPVLPFLIYYTGYCFANIFSRMTEKKFIVSSLVLIFLVAGNVSPALEIIRNQDMVEDGPQTKEAIELFEFLKTTPVNSAIVFCKARALSLYTGRHSLYTVTNHSNEEIFVQFQKHDPLFLVLPKFAGDKNIYDRQLLEYLNEYTKEYEKIWENERFNVYRQLNKS